MSASALLGDKRLNSSADIPHVVHAHGVPRGTIVVVILHAGMDKLDVGHRENELPALHGALLAQYGQVSGHQCTSTTWPRRSSKDSGEVR